MFDKELVLSILLQIEEALVKIKNRSVTADSAAFFTDSPQGMEKLDSICMLFIAIGESVKKIDKITEGRVLKKYSAIDWIGVKGFRDIVAHHYFDIDAEQVHWIIKNHIDPLLRTIRQMIKDLE